MTDDELNVNDPSRGGVDGARVKLVRGTAIAFGVLVGNGVRVLAGSLGRADALPSCRQTTQQLRGDLQRAGKLIIRGDELIFVDDVLFNSLSSAACVILGINISGLDVWQSVDGESVRPTDDLEVVVGRLKRKLNRAANRRGSNSISISAADAQVLLVSLGIAENVLETDLNE